MSPNASWRIDRAPSSNRPTRPLTLPPASRSMGVPAGLRADAAGEEREAVLSQRAEPRNVRLALAADPAEFEDIGLAQEEVALFGKEQPEAVEVDLTVIDFRG